MKHIFQLYQQNEDDYSYRRGPCVEVELDEILPSPDTRETRLVRYAELVAEACDGQLYGAGRWIAVPQVAIVELRVPTAAPKAVGVAAQSIVDGRLELDVPF